MSIAITVDFCTSQSLKDTISSMSHDMNHDNWKQVIHLLWAQINPV
jgi:hypothetical protein